MLISAQIITILFTFCGFCYTFGGKTQMDRSNGSRVTAAGLEDCSRAPRGSGTGTAPAASER